MPLLPLTPDELLTTTRAVRKRLDFERPVPDDLIRECVDIAQQSPAGSNNPTVHFLVVRDAATRAALGELYRQCYEIYKGLDGIYVGSIDKGSEEGNAQQARVKDSADYLGEHMGEAPALVIPCSLAGRTDGQPGMFAASMMANVIPAMWSFMLAARARGLGTCWTTVHLMMEQQAADIVGIPFDQVQQICMSPLAYTKGTDFKPAARPAPDTIIHWDTW
jgi:nitroreductase